MTDKQREELNKARMNEFMTNPMQANEEQLREAYRFIGSQVQLAQEEAGMSRFEAISFVATMFGASLRQG